MLAGKGVIQAVNGAISLTEYLMLPHTLTNLEMQKYYQKETKFKGDYSQGNQPKTMKDGVYIENLNEFRSIRTLQIALYLNGKSVTNFDSFGVKHIPGEIKRFIGNNKIINIFRIQAYDL